MQKKFPENERIDRIRLIRTRQIGPVTFHRLIERFGTAGEALRALPELASQHGGGAIRVCSAGEARRELDQTLQIGGELVFHGEAAYPPLLAQCDGAPAFLTVRGDIELLRKRAISIVGARNASANGQRLAHSLAADLGKAGLLVVSGLARGIDAAAHQGALASGTVAVLGGGVDVVYPRQNRDLHDAIAERGALITEARPGETPTARHFPRRNRIISGMSRGVVVVEASLRSGSLITARLAGEQGREVFAVPGAAQDPRGRGVNQLLRDGAILTETVDDILSAWPTALSARPPNATFPALAKPRGEGTSPQSVEPENNARAGKNARDRVISVLTTAPSRIDDVLRTCGVPAQSAQSALAELELDGRLDRHPGGWISLNTASANQRHRSEITPAATAGSRS